MGQRTFIVVKRNFKNGSSDIRVIHYQWGFGKTMPMLFMSEFAQACYNRNYEDNLSNYFLFNKDRNYIYDITGLSNKADIFDKNVIKNIAEQTDNNNGCMLLEVTEKDGYGFDIESVKIGFMLGWEDTKKPFTKFVSPSFYMKKTLGDIQASFLTCFRKFCETFDIEIVVDK